MDQDCIAGNYSNYLYLFKFFIISKEVEIMRKVKIERYS
jgi:hypothetical protein